MSSLIAKLSALFGRRAKRANASVGDAPAQVPRLSASAGPLELARSRLERLRASAAGCDDPRFASRLFKLCELGDAVVRESARKPGLLPVVHRFYAFDLPLAAELLEHYDRLMRSDYYNNEMEYRAKRIEHLLGTVHRRFARHLNRFKQAELTQMDMELAAYERMLVQDENVTR